MNAPAETAARTTALPKAALGLVFGLVWLSCAYFHQPWTGANQMSRLALLHAVFQHGTLAIDAYHHLTPDKAFHAGHYYSDKAPGTVVLALPGFALATVGLRLAGVELESPMGWQVSGWVACAGSQGLLAALGAVALCGYLCRWVGPVAAVVSTLAVFAGSLPLLYATTLYSHAGVAGCLAIALWAGGPWSEPEPVAPWRDWLTGHCCGWAIAAEYSSALICGGVLWLAWQRGSRAAMRVIGGALPAVLLIPAYHWACFGNPLTLGYHHEAVLRGMDRGVCGITFPPDLTNAFEMLLSPARGLFVWTPFLWLVIWGFPALLSRARKVFWFCYLVSLAHVLVMAGYYDPAAGGTVSARYFAPLLPLLAMPAALGLQQRPRIGGALGAASIGLTGIAVAVGLLLPPASWGNPLANYYFPAWAIGGFTANLGNAAGVRWHFSMVPFALMWTAGVGALCFTLKSSLNQPNSSGMAVGVGVPARPTPQSEAG